MSTKTVEKITLHLKNTKSKNIAGAFGISDKRAEELCETIVGQWEDESATTAAQAMANIAEKCDNHEELAWSMFAFGCHVAEAQETPIASLMKALTSKN